MKPTLRSDLAMFLIRLPLGLVMIYTGSQKLMGVFGGEGLAATVKGLHEGMNIPIPLVYLAIIAEFFGGLGVLTGTLTPVAAFGVACTMGTAVWFNAHTPDVAKKLFVQGDIAEMTHQSLAPTLFFIALALLIAGPGNWAIDARLFRKGKRR